MKPRVAILISGRGSNMIALIEAAKKPEYPAEIVLVLSNRADAPGLTSARDLGVPAVSVEIRPYGRDREAHERAINAELQNAGVQIVCLAGYMRLLTPYLVKEWAGRMLNIHPSLLPKYPGLDTHKKALEAGELVHGCTVHLVTEKMDAGPILAQSHVIILPEDTEDTLAARVLAEEHRIYPEALAKLAIESDFKT
ncbi:MAG: phosphoribosylglycinamide formyltransferase [Rhodospirillales bacterium 20-64-7]|nr:MAG: phosphoribosylglycinamide formyltransferase [Rhodospirillales bacterium 20-64-7]